MDAFKGKFERTSAEKYEDMLKVKKNQIEQPGNLQKIDKRKRNKIL